MSPVFPAACLAILVAFLYIKMFQLATQCTLYAAVFLTSAAMLWWAGMRFLFRTPLLGMLVIALTITFLLLVYCFFNSNYKSAVVMIRLTAKFLSDSISLVITPLILIGVGAAIFTLALRSISIRSQYVFPYLLQAGTGVFLLLLFFSFLLFYVMVYLVGNRVADWFYGRRSGCCVGLGRLFTHHLGTITYAAIVIPFIKLLQLVVWCLVGGPNSTRSACLRPFLGSCLQNIYSLVYTLNDTAIVLCTETGHDFIDAASTAGVVVLDNFDLFSAVQWISWIVGASGVILSTIVPTFAYLLLMSNYEYSDSLFSQTSPLWVALACAAVGMAVLCLFNEALVAIYLYYCFEKQLNKFGMGFPDFAIREPVLTLDYLLNGNLQGFHPIALLNAAMEQDGRLVYRPLVVDQRPPQPQASPPQPPPYPQPSQDNRSHMPSPIQPRLISSTIQSNIMANRNSPLQQPIQPNNVIQSNYQGVNYPHL